MASEDSLPAGIIAEEASGQSVMVSDDALPAGILAEEARGQSVMASEDALSAEIIADGALPESSAEGIIAEGTLPESFAEGAASDAQVVAGEDAPKEVMADAVPGDGGPQGSTAAVQTSVAGKEASVGMELSFQAEWTPPATELQAKPEDATAELSDGEVRCPACSLATPTDKLACRHCRFTLVHPDGISYDALMAARALRSALHNTFMKRRLVMGGIEIKAVLLRQRAGEGADGAPGAGREEGAEEEEEGDDESGDRVLAGVELVETIESLQVHVSKRVLRGLLSDKILAGKNGGVRLSALVALLNAEAWWPSEREIDSATKEVVRLRKKLAEMLGAEVGFAISKEDNLDFLRSMMQQAEKDRQALDEVKQFVSELAKQAGSSRPATSIDAEGMEHGGESPEHDTLAENEGSQSAPLPHLPMSAVNTLDAYTAPVVGVRAGPKKGRKRAKSALELPTNDSPPLEEEGDRRPHKDFGGAFKAINKRIGEERSLTTKTWGSARGTGGSPPPPTSLRSMDVPTSVTKQLVAHLEMRAPVANLNRFARQGSADWEVWTCAKTGKVHEPMRKPKLEMVGSARLRSREYATMLTSKSAKARTSMVEEHAGCWAVHTAPSRSIRYTRWDRLDQPIPGFSDPSKIVPRKKAVPWEKIPNARFKLGSRFAEPVGGAVEKLTSNAMLNDNLREERDKNRMVIAGQQHVKQIRKSIVFGEYDSALSHAEQALAMFSGAGKHGADLLTELSRGGPLGYIMGAVRLHVDKMLAQAKDNLQRSNYDKAMSLIPVLMEASAWLGGKGVIYPLASEPTFYEIRRGLAAIERPEGVKLVHKLKSDIETEERNLATGLEGQALASFFAAVNPRLDLGEAAHRQMLEEAEERPNRLPDQVVMDGRTYVMIVDVVPPDLPEKLRIGTSLLIKGVRMNCNPQYRVAGGEEGEVWSRGSVASFNARSNKYKVVYGEEFEWISWPCESLEVEVDIFPEQVTMSAPGVFVKSVTIPHPDDERFRAIVAFTPTPAGAIASPFGDGRESPQFGDVSFTVTGVKSTKSLLEVPKDGEAPRTTRLLPPPALRPADRYNIYDTVTGALLPDGVVEFTPLKEGGFGKCVTFQCGEQVELPEDGVYLLQTRARREIGYPWTSHNAMVVSLKGCTRGTDASGTAHVHLNRAVTRVDELRVVVTWAGDVRELDTHVYTSAMDQIDYSVCGESVNGVTLNLDSCNGTGPETATIRVKPKLGYSLSLKLVGDPAATGSVWAGSMARAHVYDSTGLIAVFHVPPVDHSAAGLQWWHVLAFHGSQWKNEGHDLFRVNQLSDSSLPDIAVPGWTIMEAASRADWEEMSGEMHQLFVSGQPGPVPVLMPQQLSVLTNMQGESLLGVVCRTSHDSTDGDDRAAGDEEGLTPAQKQMKAVTELLHWTLELDKKSSSVNAQAMGLPAEECLNKEIRERGVEECYIFRAAVSASVEVSLEIFRRLAAVVKRSPLTSKIRSFFYLHGNALLDVAVTKRPSNSVSRVVEAILSVEAMWERQQRKAFDMGDKVQVERVVGNGEFLPGTICKVTGVDRLHVTLLTRPTSGDGGRTRTLACGNGYHNFTAIAPALQDLDIVEVHPLRLRWRCSALASARTRHQELVYIAKNMDLKDGVSPEQRRILQAESALKRCISMLSEKFSE